MKKWITMLLIVAVLGFTAACNVTTSSSRDGASIELGYEINDEYEIVSPITEFGAGEEFYYSFYNDDPFETDILTLELIDSETDEVLLSYDYEVEAEWNILADSIWFNDPGKYKVAVVLDGTQRAMQEVIIN